jgi:hypothetical protein
VENNDNESMWRNVSTCRMLFQLARNIKIQLSVLFYRETLSLFSLLNLYHYSPRWLIIIILHIDSLSLFSTLTHYHYSPHWLIIIILHVDSLSLFSTLTHYHFILQVNDNESTWRIKWRVNVENNDNESTWRIMIMSQCGE